MLIDSLAFTLEKSGCLDAFWGKLDAGTDATLGVAASADRTTIDADGRDLSFVTVSVVDRAGNPCPTATNEIRYRVTGAGSYRAGANGDPTSLASSQEPRMQLFSGQATAIVASTEQPGTITLEASSPGLRGAKLVLKSK